MTTLDELRAELDRAVDHLAALRLAVADGRAPGHALATSEWYVEHLRRRLSDVTAEGVSG